MRNKSILKVCLIALVILITLFGTIRVSYLIQSQVMQRNDTYTSSVSSSNRLQPEVVWLMSFPNSGNSFTTQMVRNYANISTATNYGEEHINKDGVSEAISGSIEHMNGPFLVLSASKRRKVNGKYILTKTHCGGRCSSCAPKGYIETALSFKDDCFISRKGKTLSNGTVVYQKVQYGKNLVSGAVHLVRHPIDNVVSRYHLFLKLKSKIQEQNSTASGQPYTDDVDGFHRWCKERDEKYADEERKLFGAVAFDLFKKIPCHADFFRYAQWHNHAFNVVEEMKIPYLLLYYEDYANNFMQTKEKLFHFLEIEEAVGGKRRVSFVGGKNYSSYFTSSQKNAIFEVLKLFCNKQSLNKIGHHYFKSISIN